MKLISINISKPVEIQYQGKTVLSGIFKKPAHNKVYVSTNNIDGDAQADLINHGGNHKAVYAFSFNHYKYWRDILNNPNLGYGVFGENLTISDLNESQLYIGDQFSIGECILEVSQPRVPCFKLGVALKNTKAPKLFTKTFCTGVYFRVIKEGFIAPENSVIKISEEPESVSIKSLFQAYFDPNYLSANKIFAKALCLNKLAPEWRDKLLKKSNN